MCEPDYRYGGDPLDNMTDPVVNEDLSVGWVIGLSLFAAAATFAFVFLSF